MKVYLIFSLLVCSFAFSKERLPIDLRPKNPCLRLDGTNFSLAKIASLSIVNQNNANGGFYYKDKKDNVKVLGVFGKSTIQDVENDSFSDIWKGVESLHIVFFGDNKKYQSRRWRIKDEKIEISTGIIDRKSNLRVFCLVSVRDLIKLLNGEIDEISEFSIKIDPSLEVK